MHKHLFGILPWLWGAPLVLSLAGCGGGGDAARPAVTATDVTALVPTEASTSAQAATAYVAALAAAPSAQTDTLEPVAAPQVLAADDTAEPS